MRLGRPRWYRALHPTIWIVGLLVLASAALLLRPQPAAAQQGAGFDHVTTGFALTGRHEDVRCETCHIKAIFKGTPRECAGCHVQNNARGALAKTVEHIPTSKGCETCHTTSTFSAVLFSHASIDPGSCASCHNNLHATGKPANHVPTSASCGECHATSAFVPVLRFDHQAASFGSWTCTTCHDGHFASGKPPNHIPTLGTALCESCHQASITGGFTSFSGGQMDHRGYTSGCAQCHAPAVANTFYGVRIVSSSSTALPHIPASDTCETCHQTIPTQLIPATGAASVGGTTFANAGMSHAGITSNCAQCHGPSVTSGTFIGVTPKTSAALVPPHLPTSAPCEACHANAIPAMPIPAAGAAAVGGTTFANGQMSHQGITSNCAQCHGPSVTSGTFIGVTPKTSAALVPPHLPTSAPCEACHANAIPAMLIPAAGAAAVGGTTFANGQMSHQGITSNCVACHGPSIGSTSFA
ncbi:MAG: hypothetical protein WA210_15560, partial [Burkholderiaceae bacterium]